MLSSLNLHDIMSVWAVASVFVGYWLTFTGSSYGTPFLVLSFYSICIVILEKIHALEKNYKQEMEDFDMVNTSADEDILEQSPDNEDTESEETESVETESVETENVVSEIVDTDEHYCGDKTCGVKITENMIAGACAGCNLIYYCNAECQKRDWKAAHRFVCNSNLLPESEPTTEPTSDNEIVPEPLVTEALVAEPLATEPLATEPLAAEL